MVNPPGQCLAEGCRRGALPTRCCTTAAPPAARAQDSAARPARPARPTRPRSYPGAAASAAVHRVHTQTRWAAVRSCGPRISAASARTTLGSWGNSRALRGVASTSSLMFAPLPRVEQSEMGAPKSGVRDLN